MKSITWREQCVLAAAFLLTVVAPPALVGQQLLVPQGSVWKYMDNGSDLGTAWRQPGFNDAGWDAGPAKLGYGDSDVVTEVDNGPFPFINAMTTYFRHHFQVADPDDHHLLKLRIWRDDGAVIYLNGVEVARTNMPAGMITADTGALVNIDGSAEHVAHAISFSAGPLVAGDNVLAVEIHQTSPLSSDIGLDLELVADPPVTLVRGPYLQLATPTSMVVRWRTDVETDGRVEYGLAGSAPDQDVVDTAWTTEHEVTLTGLSPYTTYRYAIGSSWEQLAGSSSDFEFRTPPAPEAGEPTTIWVIGDSGTANDDAAAVRDRYLEFMDGEAADVWLMLGDNAYGTGTDAEYQAAVFDMYPSILRRTPLWPTRGNHELDPGVYFGAFTLPAAGQAGGLPSGTEDYYSFDHGDVHFVCLNSYELVDASVGGPMWTWLDADLAATDREWIIAYWHHPPYSKGSHDSDTEPKLIQMRQNFLPLLEEGGADLVLSGHSHCYERSYLIDGHYSFSFTFNTNMLIDGGDGREGGDGAYEKIDEAHGGTVYTVAGCSGKRSGGDLDHPVMFSSLDTMGSVVIAIDGSRMDLKFIDIDGDIADEFTLLHDSDPVCQTDLGFGSPGDMRIQLCGDALTQSGSTALFQLTDAPSLALVAFVISPANGSVPFAGGTLVPFPIEVIDIALTDINGELSAPIQGASGTPAPLYIQAVRPSGSSIRFSNALEVMVGF